METTLWLRRLFTCIILCLLTCNLAYLTSNYVKYETDTNVAPYFPVRLNATKLSLCFSISSLLDRSPHGYSFTGDQSIKYINWTFDEVFRRMPSASTTLDSCKYRDFDLDILREEKGGKRCAQLFKVIRYRMQGYICYRFTFPLDQEYSYHISANSLYNPRELYHLTIAGRLADQHIFYPLLHLDEFPDDNRVFNLDTFRESASLFQLSYDLYESHTLPSPYETHCLHESRITCYQKCFADVYRRLGYSPDSDLTVENSSSSSLRLIPLEVNVDLHRYICNKRCPYESCKQILVNTRFNKVDSSNERLLLIVETVNRLITKILYLPKFPLIDYITQVGAVVSIWTGISVITLSRLIQPRRKVALKTFFLAVKSHFTAVRLILSSRQSHNVRNDALSLEKKRLVIKLKRVSILSNLFRLSLLPVLSWQLFNVVHHYFLFQTTAKFDHNLNPQVIIPSIGFCLDYKDLSSVHSVEHTEKNYQQLFLNRDSKFNQTLKQLLQDASEDVIDGCFIRDWKSRFKWFEYNNGSSCLKHFSVKKFFYSQKLCYKIVPTQKLDNVYYQSDIKLLLTKPSIVYSIILHSKALTSRKVNIFTQFGDDLPRISSEFSVQVHKSDMRKMICLSNRFYRVHYLPVPYDTSCNPGFSRLKCVDSCISKALSRYKRLSYGSTEDRRLDMRFLSYSDLLNDSVNEMWRQTELFCDKRCWMSSCEHSFTSTEGRGQIPVKNLQNILAVDLPSQPTGEMRTVPVMTLYQFLYELLCCFSFWLGVSFIDFSPTSALMKQRMKMKVHLTQMYLVLDNVVDKLLRRGLCSSFSQKIQGLGKRKLLGFSFCYSVMSLCIFHLIHSMVTYMSYSSLIDVYEQIETRTDLTLFICLDTSELIARKSPSGIKDPVSARSAVMNRTITSLFAETPKENELIRECGHWGLNSRRTNLSQLGHVSDRIFFSTENKSICDQVYEVRKFIVQSYMCYSIWPRNFSGWNSFQLKHALSQEKTLLKVLVKSSLLTKRFTLLVNFKKYFPFTSSNFAHNIHRDAKHGQYKVTYIQYIENPLPSPRSNDEFTPFLFYQCLNKCIGRKLKNFNLTLSQRFTWLSDLRFVSYFDRQQKSFRTFLAEVQTKCETTCVEYNDQVMYARNGVRIFVPLVEARKRKDEAKSDLTTISLKSPNHPVLSITFKLKISLFQQIINLGSILSLWFGFSAVTLARIGRIRDKEIGLDELLTQKQRIRLLKAKYRIR